MLRKGDDVIRDNLSSHNSPRAAQALRHIGASSLFSLLGSLDLNSVEMAFAKMKAMIEKATAPTCDKFWQAVGHVCGLVSVAECDLAPVSADT